MTKPVTPQEMFDLWQKMVNPGGYPLQSLMFPVLDPKESDVARRAGARAAAGGRPRPINSDRVSPRAEEMARMKTTRVSRTRKMTMARRARTSLTLAPPCVTIPKFDFLAMPRQI